MAQGNWTTIASLKREEGGDAWRAIGPAAEPGEFMSAFPEMTRCANAQRRVRLCFRKKSRIAGIAISTPVP